jgi:hypothetical protein
MRYGLISMVVLILAGCGGLDVVTPLSGSHGYGVARIAIPVDSGSEFSKVASKAVISITANDMSESSKELTVSSNAIHGVVNNIPSGKNRKFDIEVLDSGNVVKYRGCSTVDVPEGSVVSVPITLVRTTGDVVITGTIVSDSITVGYRYYKFVMDSYANLGGGIYVPCFVETHFIKGGDTSIYPRGVSGLISYDTTFVGTIGAIFDGDLTANTGHVKPTSVPWSYVIDMQESYTFTGFYMKVWETFFYGVPTSVSIYGSGSSVGPWVAIGGQTFSVCYQEVTIPLVY